MNWSILKRRKYRSIPEATNALLSARGIQITDPAYRAILTECRDKLIHAVETKQLAGIDNFPDRPINALNININKEARYLVTGDLMAWDEAERAKEANAGVSPPDSDLVGIVNNATVPATEPARSKRQTLKPAAYATELDSFLRDVYDKCAEAAGTTPSPRRMLSFVLANKHLFSYVKKTDGGVIMLQSNKRVTQAVIEGWRKRVVIKEK